MKLGDVTLPLCKVAFDHPWYKGFVTCVGGAVAWLLPAEWDKKAVLAVIVLMVLDFVTGITAAWVKGHKLQSVKAKKWVGRFVGYGVAIMLAALLPRLLHDMQRWQEILVAMVCGPMVATELISIVENLEKLNVPGTDLLRKLLQRPDPERSESTPS